LSYQLDSKVGVWSEDNQMVVESSDSMEGSEEFSEIMREFRIYKGRKIKGECFIFPNSFIEMLYFILVY